jgi:hypothetical protein
MVGLWVGPMLRDKVRNGTPEKLIIVLVGLPIADGEVMRATCSGVQCAVGGQPQVLPMSIQLTQRPSGPR